jgi:hypothetical protein
MGETLANSYGTGIGECWALATFFSDLTGKASFRDREN